VSGSDEALGEARYGEGEGAQETRSVGRVEVGHRGECTDPSRRWSAPARASRYKPCMVSLRFRAPGTVSPLLTLLARALPGVAEVALTRLGRGGTVRVDGHVERDVRRTVPPGARVSAELPDESGTAFAPRVRLRGPDFAVLETSACWRRPVEGFGPALAKLLDVDPEAALPVLEADPDASGLWLVALGETARLRLAAALSRSFAREERAIAVAPPWRRGALAVDGGCAFGFQVERERDGLAELSLRPGAIHSLQLREALSRAGAPILGDARFGGRLVAGGLRLYGARLTLPEEGIDIGCEAQPDAWPEEPVFPAEGGRSGAAGDGAELAVSRATLRAVDRGHPWILTDSETGDAGRFRAGSLVTLRGPGGERGGLARIEGEGPLAARLWSRSEAAREGGSVEARIAAALARRRRLLDAAGSADGTDAFRLVHGEADGLPGLAIDRLGRCLRVLLSGRACAQVAERAVDATLRALHGELGGDPPVVEVLHLRERPPGTLEGVRLQRGHLSSALQDGSERLVVRERGLQFEVDLGLGEPTRPSPSFGLFLDQRENRARLAAHARGTRWLNLFAHTGAFTTALLAAGAAEVVSVDLSAAWLRWLEDSIVRNGLDAARSRNVRGDSRRWLERLPEGECFDGIVLDPPTAAAAGRRFWSVRRDLEPLVERALARLAPGGCLLVSRNDRAGGRELPGLVARAATRVGVMLADVAPAPPGEDFPTLAGFPEGDPFEGVLAVRSGG
jgi:23S rRNA (cytosine1962-C5)-methyltransferase